MKSLLYIAPYRTHVGSLVFPNFVRVAARLVIPLCWEFLLPVWSARGTILFSNDRCLHRKTLLKPSPMTTCRTEQKRCPFLWSFVNPVKLLHHSLQGRSFPGELFHQKGPYDLLSIIVASKGAHALWSEHFSDSAFCGFTPLRIGGRVLFWIFCSTENMQWFKVISREELATCFYALMQRDESWIKAFIISGHLHLRSFPDVNISLCVSGSFPSACGWGCDPGF